MAGLLEALMAQKQPQAGLLGGGSTMRAIPQDNLLGGLSSGLGAVRDFGNKVNVPYLGGMGDMFVGKSPEEIENWSYGNSPFQTTEMGLPQIKEERKQGLVDALSALTPMAKLTEGLPVGMAIKNASGRPFSMPKRNITVKDPIRSAFPGIYDRPDEIARRAADNVAPEDPAMKNLFGVDRNQLYDIRQTRTAGNEAPDIKMAKNHKGSALAPQIMTPRNTQRIIDVLSEAEKYPGLQKGMDSWYEMGPLYERLLQISDDPVRDFKRFQTFTGMASPGSDVLTEINRGTAALMKSNQGRFADFYKHGGTAEENRGAKFPKDMRGVMGHPYHSTAQAGPMQMFEDSGSIQMKSPKVPLYIQSAGVPETGFQMDLPVGDAHWSRGVGLADVRNNKSYKASITMPELASLGPWWNDKIAKPLGTNAVNAQARAWGTFAPATGVGTPVGAPKLELISQKIMDAAKAYGISPEEARDKLLLGQIYAPNIGLLNGGK